VKLFVNNHDLWTQFLEELDQRISDCHKRIEQVSDMVEVYRTQGEVQALRKLQKLREKVNAK
jgi:archaellum component FlaC